MVRKFNLIFISVSLISFSAVAGSEQIENWIKRLSKASKHLILTSVREEKPSFKITPAISSFRGVIKIPSYMTLVGGPAKVHEMAGQFIIDGQIICNYSPRSNRDHYYVLKSCSDGSRAGEEISVHNKMEVKLNHASANKASLVAKISIIERESIDYGIKFPYIQAEEGQILRYNGEAWVGADVSELGLEGIKGDKGEPGEMGPQGPAGPAGAPGAAGVAGAAGEKGEKGDKGDTGEAGAVGPQGPKGDAGVAGAVGPQGPKGDAGAAGSVGPQGPKGDAGAAGSVGPQGPKGDAGAAGSVGPQGPKGDAGVAGAIGPQGPAGAIGPMGPMGPQGERGLQGLAGEAGAVGPQGPKGDAGAAGSVGPQGPKGDAGATGAVGPMGPMGPQGERGLQGLAGEAGAVGPQGPAGAAGPQGEKGEKGDRGLSEIAYLRDERASSQHGGTCAGNIWNTRALNVLGGDSGFVTLSNNRFVLQPGKYFIEISAPAYATAAHQAKLKVIETNQDVLIGSTGFSHPNSQSLTHSNIFGELIVSVASTFEVQHRCAIEKLFSGLGQATGFGTVEIYTQVKIIKKQ